MTSTSSAATAPDPSRRGFRAWKESLLTGASSDPNAAATWVDSDQRSRNLFLCWCTLFNLLLVIGSTLFMIYIQQPAVGRALFVISRVLGYSGLAASLCLGILLSYLWNAVFTDHTDDQRMIDSLMYSLL
ncbi:unnamed protein product [Alopecurus aequalis]